MSSTHRTTHFSKFQYKLKSRSARASLAGLQRPLRAKQRPSASQHPRTSIERPSTLERPSSVPALHVTLCVQKNATTLKNQAKSHLHVWGSPTAIRPLSRME